MRSDLDHIAAMADARNAHAEELLALADLADLDAAKLREALAEIEGLRHALVTRDVIGVAKGIVAATLRCTPDNAFALLVAQSQHENRKISEIATEIAARAAQAHGDA